MQVLHTSISYYGSQRRSKFNTSFLEKIILERHCEEQNQNKNLTKVKAKAILLISDWKARLLRHATLLNVKVFAVAPKHRSGTSSRNDVFI